MPTDWCFQLVFDYGEHDLQNPTAAGYRAATWTCRLDPFSSYRSTFEVRTYRLCRRVLMFHHFADEIECRTQLPRAIHRSAACDSAAARSSAALLFLPALGDADRLRSRGPRGYLSSSLPPLEFEYTEAVIDETVREIDAESLRELPYGFDGSHYRWVDLDGEGLSGVLTEQAGSWFYKPNLSPSNLQTMDGAEVTLPRFGPMQRGRAATLAASLSNGAAADGSHPVTGRLDLVDFEGATPGYFERTADAGLGAVPDPSHRCRCWTGATRI